MKRDLRMMRTFMVVIHYMNGATYTSSSALIIIEDKGT